MKKKDGHGHEGDEEGDSESLFYVAIYRVTANKA